MVSYQWWEEESLPSICCLHCCWETPGCSWPSLSQGHIDDSCLTCCPSRPPGPFLKICFPDGWLQHVLVHQVIPVKCRNLCLLLLIFVSFIMRFYSHTSHSYQSSAKPHDQCHGPSRTGHLLQLHDVSQYWMVSGPYV